VVDTAGLMNPAWLGYPHCLRNRVVWFVMAMQS
jgi:hypothetical protein